MGSLPLELYKTQRKKAAGHLVDYALSSGVDWVTFQGVFQNVLLNASKEGNYESLSLVLMFWVLVFIFYIHFYF